ncbi:MAG: FecR family protein [Ginsengibacter sp.]
MGESRLEYLFNCYIVSSCTIPEEEELMSLLADPKNQTSVRRLIDVVIENTESEIQLHDDATASILQNILDTGRSIVVPFRKMKAIFTGWSRIAAVLLLFIAGAGVYLIFRQENNSTIKNATANNQPAPVSPNGNKAVLITSDGTTILLDSLQNGSAIQIGSARISKQKGSLVCKLLDSSKSDLAPTYNTLLTPRGGQYQIDLADGSKVWLNAASSLRFPSTFKGIERVVDLTGEAYFEVAKNKEKPFHVRTGEMEVTVLGTHFNVNAYKDENTIKTSLLEGAVKITSGSTSQFLKPGQQAVLDSKNKMIIANVNMDEVMAWKNGLFQFKGADIATIMREISRWYNVEVIFRGKIATRSFEGKISRNSRLSEVLRILELSDVKFAVTDNKIEVE